MFGFENLNGYLGQTFHGTRKIVYQMSFNIQLKQTLPDKLKQLSLLESSETQAYLDKFLNSHHRSNMHQLSESCYGLGKMSLHNLTTEEQTIISNSGLILQSSQVQKLKRIMLHGTIFHSLLPINAKFSRDNTFCCYQIHGEFGYGQIESIFLQGAVSFCLIHQLLAENEASPLKNLRPSCIADINNLNYWDKLKEQVVCIRKDTLVAIPINDIISKCIYINIPIRGQHANCIIQLPNAYEVH